MALGRYAEAEPPVLASHEAALAQFGPDHDRTLAVHARVVALYEAWGRPDRARTLATPQPD